MKYLKYKDLQPGDKFVWSEQPGETVYTVPPTFRVEPNYPVYLVEATDDVIQIVASPGTPQAFRNAALDALEWMLWLRRQHSIRKIIGGYLPNETVMENEKRFDQAIAELQTQTQGMKWIAPTE